MSDASQAEREPEMDYPTSKLSAKDLTTLTESMGFTIIRAQKGLLNSTSLEGAIDWILNHENDNDIDDPISMVLKSSCKSADATHPYKCNECGKFLGNMTNLELHADKYGHSNFEETGQGMQLLSEEKNTQLQEINSSMVKSNHLGIRDGQDKLLDFEREKQMWDEGKKSAQTKEEMEKEARLIEAKVMRKKKRGECMKERAKIKAEIERDRLELEDHQGKPTSHLKTNRYNHDHDHGNQLEVNSHGKKSAQTKEEMEKEARLIEAKVTRKKKREECMRERARIKAEIERDRLELEAYQGRPTSHRKTNRYNHDHGHQRDANADEKKSAETREEMEKEARLREVKLLMKKKREECTRERARIKAEIEKDRLEFKTLQLKPTSHLKTNGCNHGHGNQRDVNADEKKSAETREQIEKEARLIESKLLIKKKHKEFMKERARIKAEIEKDRLEFKTLQLKPTSHLKTNGCNHGHGNQRDVNADEKKSAETREQIEKEARLIESKLLIKKKHKEFMKERARIKAEIEKDRLDFKTLQLKSNFEPMVDRYNPDGNHAKVNTNVATRRHPHEPVRKKKKGDVSKIDEYIQKISSYKAGGYGGKCLKILLTYITNIVDKPFEKKYRQINMDNKIFKSKVKPFVGAKMLLLAVGFSPDMDERNTALVLVDNANVNVLEQTKEKLERAYASYSISFNSWIPA